MPLDTPKSYFEYINRGTSKVYAVFKTSPQGKAIFKPTCLRFGTLKGLKHSFIGFPRPSWRAFIFDPFFSCFKMCLERQLGGQKVPQQPQEAARRLSGEGAGTAPKSTQERKPAQDAPGTPKRCCQTPFGDQFFDDFRHQHWDILNSAPSLFVDSRCVFESTWIRYSLTYSILFCTELALSLLTPVHVSWYIKLEKD